MPKKERLHRAIAPSPMLVLSVFDDLLFVNFILVFLNILIVNILRSGIYCPCYSSICNPCSKTRINLRNVSILFTPLSTNGAVELTSWFTLLGCNLNPYTTFLDSNKNTIGTTCSIIVVLKNKLLVCRACVYTGIHHITSKSLICAVNLNTICRLTSIVITGTTNSDWQCATCCQQLNVSLTVLDGPVEHYIVEVPVRIRINGQVLGHDTTFVVNRCSFYFCRANTNNPVGIDIITVTVFVTIEISRYANTSTFDAFVVRIVKSS